MTRAASLVQNFVTKRVLCIADSETYGFFLLSCYLRIDLGFLRRTDLEYRYYPCE